MIAQRECPGAHQGCQPGDEDARSAEVFRLFQITASTM